MSETTEQVDFEASSLAIWNKECTVSRHGKVRRWVVMMRADLHMRLWQVSQESPPEGSLKHHV